ncbi:MAG: trehalose-phosphatase [Betaproteobacteria bacterium]|nr:MAG: trehalose-phosphatase [Betaproteobacteria bacterium]
MTLLGSRIALLLDVDGTLLDLAAHPDLVVVDPGLPELLRTLQARLGGALALVSGRPIAALDALFAPFRGSAAGLHGLEIRQSPHGGVTYTLATTLAPAFHDAIAAIVDAFPAAFIEHKAPCVAVHHRLDAASAERLRQALQEAIDAHAPDWHLLGGRLVFDVKPAAADKGGACRTLMRTEPFRGRLPIYLGDDTTDLDAFSAVAALGGQAVAVGPRVAMHAANHLPGAAAVRSWLRRLDRMLARDVIASEDADLQHVLARLDATQHADDAP